MSTKIKYLFGQLIYFIPDSTGRIKNLLLQETKDYFFSLLYLRVI